MKTLRLVPFILLFLLLSCEKDNSNDNSPSSDIPESGWLIPTDDISNSLHAMDFIPSIDSPTFKQIINVSNIDNENIVLIFREGENVRVYPHKILRHHEIVNDNIGEKFYAISYCPLTGSGLNWDRRIDGEVTEFGVSGLLYRSNLIPYDRNTVSFWSQMLIKCVNGEQIKTEPVMYPLIETTFETARKVFPSAYVLQNEQKSTKEDFPEGERMYGVIIKDNAFLFPYTLFNDSVSVIQGYFNKKEVILAGSQPDHFAMAYINTTSNPLLKFSAVSGKLPIIMEDNEGNIWDMFGHAVEGPMKGTRLEMARGYVAYYWAWQNFYPDLQIINIQNLK